MAHDPTILNAMAIAISGAPFASKSSLRKATAALDAIEAMGCVVVPVEPTGKMLQAGHEAGSALSRCSLYERLAVSFRSMIVARPGAQP